MVCSPSPIAPPRSRRSVLAAGRSRHPAGLRRPTPVGQPHFNAWMLGFRRATRQVLDAPRIAQAGKLLPEATRPGVILAGVKADDPWRGRTLGGPRFDQIRRDARSRDQLLRGRPTAIGVGRVKYHKSGGSGFGRFARCGFARRGFARRGYTRCSFGRVGGGRRRALALALLVQATGPWRRASALWAAQRLGRLAKPARRVPQPPLSSRHPTAGGPAVVRATPASFRRRRRPSAGQPRTRKAYASRIRHWTYPFSCAQASTTAGANVRMKGPSPAKDPHVREQGRFDGHVILLGCRIPPPATRARRAGNADHASYWSAVRVGTITR